MKVALEFKARLEVEACLFVDWQRGRIGPRGAPWRAIRALAFVTADRGSWEKNRKSGGWTGHIGAGRTLMGVMEPRRPFCFGPSSAGSAASRFAGTRNRGSSDRGRACRADGRREPASITRKPIGATRPAMRATIRQVQGATSNSLQVAVTFRRQQRPLEG